MNNQPMGKICRNRMFSSTMDMEFLDGRTVRSRDTDIRPKKEKRRRKSKANQRNSTLSSTKTDSSLPGNMK